MPRVAAYRKRLVGLRLTLGKTCRRLGRSPCAVRGKRRGVIAPTHTTGECPFSRKGALWPDTRSLLVFVRRSSAAAGSVGTAAERHRSPTRVPGQCSSVRDRKAAIFESLPSTAGETFYDLAVRALADQESQVASLRTRTGTLVAGAAVVATLLADPVFAKSHPDGLAEWIAAGVGVAAVFALLAAAVLLLRSHDLAFALDVRETYTEAEERGDLDEATNVGFCRLNSRSAWPTATHRTLPS